MSSNFNIKLLQTIHLEILQDMTLDNTQGVMCHKTPANLILTSIFLF